jgi:radical SAM protein with 4Fe4S-binding SPASM domain
MIRFTQFLHGRGTVSRIYRHDASPSHKVPGSLLAYSRIVRPVVFWNITRRCNLSCRHCYLDAGPGRDGNAELSTAEALAFIDDLADLGSPLLIISGGEPLVREDVWELFSRARDRSIGVALSSNGTLITQEIARRLKEEGVEYAGISLDGSDRETHERLRNVPGCFDAALAGLAHCRDAGIKTGVRFTATRDNQEDLGPLIRLSREIRADRFCVYWLVPSGRGRAMYESAKLTPGESRKILETLYHEALATPPDEMEFLSVDAPQDVVFLLERLKSDKPEEYDSVLRLLDCKGAGCSAGFRVASVDPTGNVYPCQFAQDDRFLVGSIRDQRFSTLWNDPANPVLREFRDKTVGLSGRCGTCRFKAICGGGCRIRAWYATCDFRADDPFCDLPDGEADETNRSMPDLSSGKGAQEIP